MHFTTVLATSAAIGGALAGVYAEEPAYYTTSEKVYTSVKTCTDKPAVPTSEAVYAPPTSEAVYVPPTTEDTYVPPTSEPVYAPAPSDYPAEVTYTSYDVITITSCGEYVTNCPAATYTSTAYSVSTCTGVPTYYQPPVEYPTTAPVYEVPSSSEVYTHTYYTTVCPGKDYCYATTVTSTYCPGSPTPVPPQTYPHEVPSYTKPAPPPVYTSPPTCPGGDYCPPTPPKNETTPTYSPPPSYTGAASANAVSFGVAALAGLAALFIAA